MGPFEGDKYRHPEAWRREVEFHIKSFETYLQQIWKQLPAMPQQPPGLNFNPGIQVGSDDGGIPIKNDSGAIIPAYGLVRLTGVTVVVTGGLPKLYYTVSKPNAFGSQYDVWVNGPDEIAIGGTGFAQSSEPYLASYETGDGTPAFGELWGPRNNEWVARKNTGGFKVLGGSGGGLVRIFREPFLVFAGTAHTAFSANASGTAKIFMGANGSETDTGVTVTAFNRYGAIAINKKLDCLWFGRGWQVNTVEC